MLEEYLGKKVQIKTGHEGEVTEYGLKVIDVDGTLIKVQDSQGKARVINTISPNFSEISLYE